MAVATLAAGLLAAAAMTALAGERLRTREASVTIAQDEDGTASARCPAGTKAASGGFKQDFEPEEVVIGTSPQLQQFRSQRAGGRRWKGSAYNGGDPGALTTFAYCRPGALERSSKRTTIAGTPFMQPNTTGGVSAKCPGGSTAMSGGFSNPSYVTTGDYDSDTRILPYVSRRKGDRRWKIEAQNSGGAEGTLVAHAYCDEGPAPKVARRAATFSPPVDEVQAGSVVARCDRGHRVVSGGFKLGPEPSLVVASRRVGGRRWKVTASVAYPSATRVTAYAYCEPKP